MNPIVISFFTVLLISSGIILYQDFKERQVSLWVLIIFGANTIVSVLYFRDSSSLFYNSLGIIAYMGFTWLMLKLYFYLKFKKNSSIIDEQLGMADVLVILCIGLTFNLVGMILFFCIGFVFSLLSFLIYTAAKKTDRQSIPLAGLLVFFYVVTIIILNLIRSNQFVIDCSFVLL